MIKVNFAYKKKILVKNSMLPLCLFDTEEYCIIKIKDVLLYNKYLCEVENNWLLERLFYCENLLANAYVCDNFWLVSLTINSKQNLQLTLIKQSHDYLREAEPVFIT